MTVERWLGPNFNPAAGGFVHSYSDASWGAYFADPHCLDAILPSLDVVQIPWDWGNTAVFASDPLGIYRNLFGILSRAGKRVCIAGGYISNTTTANGAAIASVDLLAISQMMALGSPLPTIIMDGYPALLFGNGFTQTDANTQLVNYLNAIYATRPSCIVGHDVNFPSWAWHTTPSYTGTTTPYTDYSAVLTSLVSAMNSSASIKWSFEQVDTPFDWACAQIFSVYAGVASVDWIGRILQLQTQAQGAGLKFGLILNCDTPGQKSDDRWFYEATLDWQKTYSDRGGSVDQVIVESWFAGPTALLPASKPGTLTSLFLAAVNGLPSGSTTPPYRAGSGGVSYFYGANMGAPTTVRPTDVRAGWTVGGVAL